MSILLNINKDDRKIPKIKIIITNSNFNNALIKNRNIPKKLNLRLNAANITEPVIEASTCASGSHIKNGHEGTLVIKVMLEK